MPKDGCESACLFFAKKISNNKKKDSGEQPLHGVPFWAIYLSP